MIQEYTLVGRHMEVAPEGAPVRAHGLAIGVEARDSMLEFGEKAIRLRDNPNEVGAKLIHSQIVVRIGARGGSGATFLLHSGYQRGEQDRVDCRRQGLCLRARGRDSIRARDGGNKALRSSISSRGCS